MTLDIGEIHYDMRHMRTRFDIVRLAKAFGSFFVAGATHPNWDSRVNLKTDEVIDIFDVVSIIKMFGYAAPSWTPP